MLSELVETHRREAIVAVFSRLGDANYAMLKENLRIDYDINIDQSDFSTLEELQIALQRLVGVDGAILLVKEIRNQIALLAMG